MPKVRVRAPEAELFAAGFRRIRDELGVPATFPPEVLAEARATANTPASVAGEREDATDLPLVTIDPPGSRDLDQAFAGRRTGAGFRIDYAIADVAAFVRPDGALDRCARQRGVTLYPPDGRVPLHPVTLGEDAASLLPRSDRLALLWTVDLDRYGDPTAVRLRRATVRSRAQLSYAEAQLRLAEGHDDENLQVLRDVGRLRRERAIARGAVSLDLPAQAVVPRDGGYALRFDTSLPVEEWNAQISLLTGLVAAEMMVEAGIGVLRTLPEADEGVITELRRHALALGVAWPDGVPYAFFIRSLDSDVPAHGALLAQAVRVFRGAGYVAFDGSVPADARHAAIAAHYAHVTAPLRRLVDRFANEVLVALAADREPPAWVREGLPELPAIMADASRRERDLERAVVDFVEAVVLGSRRGERFPAVVTGLREEGAVVQILDPAVIGHVEADGLVLGQQLRVEVAGADLERGRVELRPVP